MEQKLYSVITGDIVGSSQLSSSEQKKIGEVFQQISSELKKIFPDAVKYDLDHYRGDGWQLLIQKPEQSLKIAIFIRALLKSGYLKLNLDSKTSIAIGKVDAISEERISQSRGEVFTNSGRKLEILKKKNMIFHCQDETLNEYLNLLFGFIDNTIINWTDKQAFAVLGVLKGMNQQEVADYWQPNKINQSSVNKHLKLALWELLEDTLDLYNSIISKI